MRLLPSGDRGLLLEVGSLQEVLDLYDVLQRTPPPGVIDLVPAGRTVLLVLGPGADPVTVGRAVKTVVPGDARQLQTAELEIPVRYDGEDLEDVAKLLGYSIEGLVSRHRLESWTVAFCGFAPGFGYLTGSTHEWSVPRRSEPRTRVPAGSLALAGQFTGVYPRESPGGWQLIGHSEVQVFDLHRDPPALLAPGTKVRFVEVAR